MRMTFLLVATALILFSCGNDDRINNPLNLDCEGINLANISVITGVVFYDVLGAPIGEFGTANDNSLVDNGFRVFPNPAINVINFLLSEGAIEAFWIYQVNCPLDCTEMSITTDDYDSGLYDESEDSFIINSGINGDLENPTGSFLVDLSSLDEGSYRALIRLETGEYQWQNIIKNNEVLEIPEVIEFINAGCR